MLIPSYVTSPIRSNCFACSFFTDHQIDTCRLDARMSQHVGQSCDILARLIIYRRKQPAEVVRKYLAGCDACSFAQPFQLVPDLSSGDTASASRTKDLSARHSMLLRVLQQLAAKLRAEQDGSYLPLERDGRPDLSVPPLRSYTAAR